MRVLFMGTPDYATRILEALISQPETDVIGLFCQPDKPVGRKQVLTPPDSKRFLIEMESNIPVFQPKTLKDSEIEQAIRELKPDYIVVAAYGKILPKAILNIAPCINLHASLLPRYRGASPIQESILHRDSYTGVTAMLMEEGLDTGDMIGYSVLKMDRSIKVDVLFDRLAEMAAALTRKVLTDFTMLKPLKQFDCDARHCRKIKKENGLVVFDHALEVETKFRAYDPWPGVYLESGLKLKGLICEESESVNEPGRILALSEDSVLVGCRQGVVRLTHVQAPSKKMTDALSYLRGKRLDIGDTLV